MSDAQPKKLLVVDDDPIIRRAIERALEGEPYRTLTAESGARALEMLASEEIDVVLSDQNMPEMDGITLLEEVKRRHPNVVRVMLTSDNDTNVFANALSDAGVRRFLHKPWDDDQLRGALRTMVASRSDRSSVTQFFGKLGIKQ